jgi:hypothetical protein
MYPALEGLFQISVAKAAAFFAKILFATLT